MPSLQSKPSDCCEAHTVYLHPAGTFNPPFCATLWLVHEVHQMVTTHIPPLPSLLAWVLCTRKAPSGQFNSPINLNLSWGLLPLWSPAAPLWSMSDTPWFGANHTPPPPSLLAQLLSTRVPCTDAEPSFEWIPLGCRQDLQEPRFSHNPTLWPVQSLSGSWSVMVQLFFHLQVSPGTSISLVLPQKVTTVPARECHLLCASYCVFIHHSDFKHLGLSWLRTSFPALGGEGAAKLLSLTRLSSKTPTTVMVPGAGPGELSVGLQNILTGCY